MFKAVRITKESQDVINATVEIREDVLETLAENGDWYLLTTFPNTKVMRETVHESIFEEFYQFIEPEQPSEFTEVDITT